MNVKHLKLSDLPPLARKYLIEKEGWTDPGEAVALSDTRKRLGNSDPEEMRQRIEDLARGDLDAQAERLAQREGIEYGTAVRRIVAEDAAYHQIPTVPRQGSPTGYDEAEMERAVAVRMDTDKENYRD